MGLKLYWPDSVIYSMLHGVDALCASHGNREETMKCCVMISRRAHTLHGRSIKQYSSEAGALNLLNADQSPYR